jgi:hypothetical protein
MDVLRRIKQLVVRRRVAFTEKARIEMQADGLDDFDVFESLLNARRISRKRSTSLRRRAGKENVWIIVAPNHRGTEIYTKGVIRRAGGVEHFDVLISAKRSAMN